MDTFSFCKLPPMQPPPKRIIYEDVDPTYSFTQLNNKDYSMSVMRFIKTIKNRKIDLFWLVVVLLFTIPFIYIEVGFVTAGMIFIIYTSQIFQFWAINELQDDIKTLFDNDICVMKVFNELSYKK